MATKKSKSSKSKVKVGKLKVQTTKVKSKDMKKVKGGGAVSGGWDIKQNVKV
jgi:hypothetical protein